MTGEWLTYGMEGRMEVYNTAARFMEPRSVRITRNAFGKLSLEVDGDRFEEIKVARSFPHTAPELYVSIADGKGKEIGLIEDLRELDEASFELIEAELSLAYFNPAIQRIRKVTTHHGATTWHVDTDRGPRVLHVRERSDIRWLSATKVVLTDVNGIRYEIPHAGEMDEDSKVLLEQES